MENTVSPGTSDIDTSGGDCVPSDNFHSGTGKIKKNNKSIAFRAY